MTTSTVAADDLAVVVIDVQPFFLEGWMAGETESLLKRLEFLFALADDISVIHWGQVIARGTPAELKENPWVQASNLGRLH